MYCIETTGRTGLFLARSLPFIYTTLCCKEIRVPRQITVLRSGNLSQTLDLEKFCRGKWILLSTELVDGWLC